MVVIVQSKYVCLVIRLDLEKSGAADKGLTLPTGVKSSDRRDVAAREQLIFSTAPNVNREARKVKRDISA